MAEQVGLAPSAVHERVRRLREDGWILEDTSVLDRRRLGYGITAFVNVRTDAPLAGDEIGEALSQIPEVLETHDIAGESCFLLKVIVQDIPDLHELVNRVIGGAPHVNATTTTIVMKSHKETTRVPVPGAPENQA